MASSTTEGSDLWSSNMSSTTSDTLESIISATTLDLFTDFQESTENSGDPTLPELPSFVASTVNRKRDRDEYLASSSDTPLFSSDDLPASSAENYYGPRVKRQHRRPWYETEESWKTAPMPSSAKKPRMRGPFKRTYDSGVWLGSDESTENEDVDRQDAVRRALRVMESGASIDDDNDEELWHEDERELDLENKVYASNQTLEEKLQQALVNKALRITEDPGGFEGPVFPYWQKQPGHLMGFHLVQEQAQKKVALCVEQGEEVIDLSTRYMQQIRTPTLRPLRYHTKIVSKQGKGNRYQSLTPALRLYLSNNLLEEVPGEVFHLKNLEVLSLRSNNLTEILPSIGELNSLKELNLGSNQLNWLPWELLGHLHANLKKCMVYPNPLIRPVPSTWNPAPSRRFESGEPCQVASTRIAFLDITGASFRHWPPAPSSLPEHWPEPQADDEFLGPPPEERTKTPSLLELALRACKKSPQLSQLPFLIPENCPEHLTKLVQKTWILKEAGGKSCSVCGNEYIIPRTEWIEWWYCIPEQGLGGQLDSLLAMHGMPVPLLRRGCSWACWEENASPLIRGCSSATLPGGLKEERAVPGKFQTSPTRRTIPPSGRIRQ